SNVISLSAEGLHKIEFRAVRNGVPEVSDFYAVIIDTTPPATAFDAGTGLFGGFLRPDAQITLSSTDTVSGVASVQYVVDGTTYPYTGPFTLLAERGLQAGIHTPGWYAADAVSNQEQTHSITVTLDNLLPSATIEMVGGHQINPFGTTYASGDTGYVATATD